MIFNINDIYINNNKIYLNVDKEINNIKMYNKSINIYSEIKKNTIDLKDIIEKNEMFFIDRKVYKVFQIENEDIEREIYSNNISANKKVYIAKGLKIVIEKRVYNIDIYLNKKGALRVDIGKISEENEFKVEFDSIQLSDESLNLSLSIAEKINDKYNCEINYKVVQLSQDILEECKLILIPDNNKMDLIQYSYKNYENGIIKFNINLINLLKKEDCKLIAVLSIDNYIYKFEIPEKTKFKPVNLEKDNIFKCINIDVNENQRLLLDINLNIKINPVITSISFDKGLIIKGNINSNINIFRNKNINCFMKFISNDNKFIEMYNVSFDGNTFIGNIPEKNILELKNSYKDEWNIELEVNYNNKTICSSNIAMNEKSSVSKKKSILYSNESKIDEETIISQIIVQKNCKYVQVLMRNKVNITKINFIEVKRNKLRVRYRTKENIQNLVKSNKLKVDIEIKNIKLKQSKIKNIGKKTFAVEYLCNDAKDIALDMYKKGITAYISSEKVKSISQIEDIDRDTIFNNLWQRVQHSKKYKNVVRYIYAKLLTRLPIKRNWIVYESFLGRNMSDSPKYIYQYLEKEHPGEYKHIWVFNNKREDVPSNIKQVKRFSFQHLYYIARSRFWINNMRQPTWFIKRNNQVFLATWHGTPLKKLVFDIEEIHSANKDYKQEFYTQSRVWDYLISANEYSTEIFKRAFKFDNTILELGYPRNDLMYSENKEQIAVNLKKKLGIPLDKKIVLYAPTWRDDEILKPGKYKFDLQLDLKRLRRELGDQYFFVLRTHYFIANYIDVEGMEDFVYNASRYDDITDLYLISDVLITDYSSVFFDYANLKRPILFFTYDLEKYRDVLRGFYLDLESEGPGPIVMNNDEIISELKDFNKLLSKYNDKINKFNKRFCSLDDGKAAERITKEVILKNK